MESTILGYKGSIGKNGKENGNYYFMIGYILGSKWGMAHEASTTHPADSNCIRKPIDRKH